MLKPGRVYSIGTRFRYVGDEDDRENMLIFIGKISFDRETGEAQLWCVDGSDDRTINNESGFAASDLELLEIQP